jgi:NitT/TauT family transport system permease protein
MSLLRRTYPGLLKTLSLLGFVLFWQAASRGRWDLGLRFQFVPAPTDVLRSAQDLFRSPLLLSHIRSSVLRVYAGFFVAAVLAVGLGLAVGRFKVARWLFMPTVELLRPIPAVAWIPLAILMFPTPEESMVYITFVGAFFPVLLATIHGVESVDHRYVYASQTLGAKSKDVFVEVLLPGALPSIVTGLSIGMGNSWFSLVTAEMISGQFGVGYYTWEAYTMQNYPEIVLGMIAIGVLGMGSSRLIVLAGRRVMPWHHMGGVIP